MPANWERIKSLFDVLISLEPDRRGAWLDEVSAGSPELRATLEELIRTFEEETIDSPEGQTTVFQPGQIVAARFRVTRLIARGGMGEVYEVVDSAVNGLRLALKTIRTNIGPEWEAYERFKREVWVAREISHKNICRIYDLVEHRELAEDGTERVLPCLTMKLLEGENLADYLRKSRPLSIAEALPVVRQLVEALNEMHAKGIVHRDLKPSNIMLVPPELPSGSTRAVIFDFGLSKPLKSSLSWETRLEQQAGSPYFLAPETLGGKRGEIAADIYALGLVIDEMVTNSPAFTYDSMQDLFLKKLNGEPLRPSSRSQGLPKAWDDCILWCLQRDPDHRPASVSDVLAVLENRSPAPPAVIGVPVTPNLRSRLRLPLVSRRTWIALAGLSLLSPTAFVVDELFPLQSSILIFPFENVTGRKEYDYLCSGAVDELLRRLLSIQFLRVYPVRNSKDTSAVASGKAQYSLRGYLQQHEGHLRLNLQLLGNPSGVLLWTRHFDHRDALQLQAEITSGVVAAVGNHVVPEESSLRGRLHLTSRVFAAPVRTFLNVQPSAPQLATASSAAFDLYLRGRDAWQRRTLADTLEAIGHLKAAIEKDPGYALAYSALADVQTSLLTLGYGNPEALQQAARTYAAKAMELDPNLPEVQVTVAAVRQMDWDWAGAEAAYRKAIDVQPRFAQAYHWYAGLPLQFGRFEQALEISRKGMELDPFNYPGRSAHGLYLWHSGRLSDAAGHLEKLIGENNWSRAHSVLGQIYAEMAAGSPEPRSTDLFVRAVREAGIVQAKEVEEAGGRDPGYLKWSDLIYAQAYSARKDVSSAQLYIDRLERGFETGSLPASLVARAWVSAGNHTRAMQLLEIGLQRREREMAYTGVSTLLRPLHGDPRFTQILTRMGLNNAITAGSIQQARRGYYGFRLSPGGSPP